MSSGGFAIKRNEESLKFLSIGGSHGQFLAQSSTLVPTQYFSGTSSHQDKSFGAF